MANDSTSPRASKARTAKPAKAAAKPTKARATARTRTAAARKRGTTAGAKRAAASSRSTTALAGDYVERAVLIPVGAALVARDRVVSGVNEVITNYSSPAKAQTQLRRFERRGSTARNRLEREVRKTRTRLERELRERRRELDRRREGV